MSTLSDSGYDAQPDGDQRRPLAVAAAQPVCHPADVAANITEHRSAIERADADLVVFPELSITGYDLSAAAIKADDPRLGDLIAACAKTNSTAMVGAVVSVDFGRSTEQRQIAMLQVTGTDVTVAYRKMCLGSDEQDHFRPGRQAGVVNLELAAGHTIRVGLAICKDTGTPEFTTRLLAENVDLIVAGLVHGPGELAEQDRRGRTIATTGSLPVVFASAAGFTGTLYPEAVGNSTVWDHDGTIVARANSEPGAMARAELAL